MTWSLGITNGDLNLGGISGINIVTGYDKLKQDLKAVILEPLGTDPMHPDFGSSLDGGFDSNGVEIPTSIGGSFSAESVARIQEEIVRVLQNYQKNQIARIREQQNDTNGKTYFQNSEILYRIDNISVQQIQDKLLVNVNITTAAGQSFNITQPVGF